MQNGVKWLLTTFGNKKAPVVAQSWGNVFDMNNPHVINVLKDLSIYCNFNKSSFHINPNQCAFNEGARDVFLHIMEMSNINPQKLVEIFQNNISGD